MAEKIRKAFVLKLKPNALAEYIDWHDKIWPELQAEIRAQGIAEITLFNLGDQVFLFSEVADADSWSRLWASEIHKQWGSGPMAPLMHYRPDGVVDSEELTEIWHFDATGGA